MMERARGELLGEGERWCVQGVDAERVHLLGRMSSCEGGRRKLASQQELLKAHVCPMPSGGGHGEHGVNICSLREVEASTGEAGPSFCCVQSPPAHRSSQAATSPGRQCCCTALLARACDSPYLACASSQARHQWPTGRVRREIPGSKAPSFLDSAIGGDADEGVSAVAQQLERTHLNGPPAWRFPSRVAENLDIALAR